MINIEDIEKVKSKFEELGRSIAETSDLTDEFSEVITSSLRDGLSSILSNILSSEEFKNIAKATDISSEYLETLEKTLKDRVASIDTSLSDVETGSGDVLKGLEGVSDKISGLVAISETQEKVFKVPTEDEALAEEGKASSDSGKPGLMAQEGKSLKAKLDGLLSKLHVPKKGAFLAGGLGIIIYSELQKDRIKKEAGEVTNIVIGAFDSGSKGLMAKAKNTFSSFQETLQKFYGISKEEPQKVKQELVAGGVGITEMLQKVDSDLGMVGKNIVSFSLGFDKMLNLPGGESAKKMVKLVSEYGKSLKDAEGTYKKLVFAGRESGIGTLQFMKNVESAADQLKQYGYDMDNVIDIAVNLQKHFEEMGVPRQFAGRQAAIGLQQFAKGMVSMSDSWKIMIAKEMGLGSGLEGRQKLMESWTRISEGKGEEDLERQIKAIYKVAMRVTGGDEARARLLVEKELGFGFEGSNVVMKIGELLEKGEFKEANLEMKKNSKILKDSFKTEKKKHSEWQLKLNEYLKAAEKIGQGLLGLITNALAALLTFFQMLPTLFLSMFDDDYDADVGTLQKRISSFIGAMGESVDLLKQGFTDMGGALGKMAEGVFGPIIDAITNEDLGKGYGTANRRRDSGTQQPIVQIVTIPSVGKAAGHFYNEPTGGRPRVAKGEEGAWAGGQITVVSEGVNDSGDIKLKLVGNCPRCGLSFGGGTGTGGSIVTSGVGNYTAQDVEAAARMLRQEIGGYSKNRETLAAGTVHTALNRARSQRKSVYDAITGGHGWGRQGIVPKAERAAGKGKSRPFGTTASARPQDVDFVKKVMRGEVEDPTRGATAFIHATPGDEFKQSKKEGLSTALPPFAHKMAMTASMPMGKGLTAMFFGSGKELPKEAAVRKNFTGHAAKYTDKAVAGRMERRAQAPKE